MRLTPSDARFDHGKRRAFLAFGDAGDDVPSLDASRRISKIAAERLQKLVADDEHPDRPIIWFTTRNGRAEEDEHVMGVNVTEITMSLNPNNKRSQDEMKKLLVETVGDLPGTELEVEQPIAH